MKKRAAALALALAALACALFLLGRAAVGIDRVTGAEPSRLYEDRTDAYYRALESIPPYSGEDCITLNGDVPYFTPANRQAGEAYEYYSRLDALGRCGLAAANVGRELMPDAPRESIGMVKPSGWHTVRYDGIVERNYLYNRCHLLAYQLTGENANEKNLITGTRHLNTVLMMPIENRIGDYIRSSGNHVLYRVTPLFRGRNLVADGVLIEAESLEDGGKSIRLCRFLYNVQPGIQIDYATGDSAPDGTMTPAPDAAGADPAVTYILNTGSMVFHRPDCPNAADMSERNKRSFTGTRGEAVAEGYQPCGWCKP